MSEQYNVCLVTGIGKWVLLIKFFPEGEIDQIIETEDNPGVRGRNLEAFMSSRDVSQNDKDLVREAIDRLKAKAQTVKPLKKTHLGLLLLDQFKVSPKVLRITQTKK